MEFILSSKDFWPEIYVKKCCELLQQNKSDVGGLRVNSICDHETLRKKN